MLFGAAAALYPVLLPSTLEGGREITIAHALASPHTLRVGLAWWTLGTLPEALLHDCLLAIPWKGISVCGYI